MLSLRIYKTFKAIAIVSAHYFRPLKLSIAENIPIHLPKTMSKREVGSNP